MQRNSARSATATPATGAAVAGTISVTDSSSSLGGSMGRRCSSQLTRQALIKINQLRRIK